ncbi:MAG: hypothetical protein Q7N50_05355 [Armatimonadota bacterium]|nr:hypothetical protein [Armatimonadota bacterium]
MKRLTVSVVIGIALLVAGSLAAFAAPSVFGTSGNIITPDDTIVAPGGLNLAYHGIVDFAGSDDTLNIFGGNFGLFPNLEVGAAVATNGDSELLLNGKYRLLAETASRPAITVGAIDLSSELFSDAGIYILFSKSLTQFAEEVADRPSRPLRGHLGLGDGPLSGVFAGLDWTLTPKLSAMLEFISDSELEGGGGGSLFNGGLRYALTDEIRLDASLIDFDDFSFGASYQTLKF